MYRLVHLSDLHYRTANRESVRTLLATVCDYRPDHLVISGDLTDDGQAVHYRGLRDLLEKFGFARGDRLTVVPGNHDQWGFIYQVFSHPAGVLGGLHSWRTFRERVRLLWTFRRRLRRFRHHHYEQELRQFCEHYADTFPAGNGGFPYVKLLPHNTALIALDSNRLLPRVYGWHTLIQQARAVIRTHDLSLIGQNLSGSAGEVDLSALESLLERPEVRDRRKIAVLHHCPHPIEFLARHMRPAIAREVQLMNQRELTALLERHGVELVLHGHVHILERSRLSGSIHALNGGGAMDQGFFHIDVQPDALRVHRVRHGQPAVEIALDSPLSLT